MPVGPDSDYQMNSGTLTFDAGDSTKTITVLVNGDAKYEDGEAFTVQLSNASDATISDADGTGTITNDDAAPALSIDDVTHDEGDSGTTPLAFTVTADTAAPTEAPAWLHRRSWTAVDPR